MTFTFMESVEGGFLAWFHEKDHFCLVEAPTFRALRPAALAAQALLWDKAFSQDAVAILNFVKVKEGKEPQLLTPTAWDNPVTVFEFLAPGGAVRLFQVETGHEGLVACWAGQSEVYVFPEGPLKVESLGLFKDLVLKIQADLVKGGHLRPSDPLMLFRRRS